MNCDKTELWPLTRLRSVREQAEVSLWRVSLSLSLKTLVLETRFKTENEMNVSVRTKPFLIARKGEIYAFAIALEITTATAFIKSQRVTVNSCLSALQN